MIEYRFFEYDISKYTGYRLISEKSNMKYFRKIEYDGFKSILNDGFVLRFKIEKQLIRRLKFKNISDSIKSHSVEHKILELIEKSEEFNPNDPNTSFNNSFTHWSSYDYSYDQELIQEEKNRIKYINKHQQRQYNNKMKQYENKGRFR